MNRLTTAVAAAAVVALLAGSAPAHQGRGRDTLPATLSDAEFWSLTERLSEAGGSFVSRSGSPDNLLSNENTISSVAAELAARVEARRRLPRRRAGAELHLHRRDAAAPGVHHRHPPRQSRSAPDVQGALRVVGHAERVRRAALQPPAAGGVDAEDHGGGSDGAVRRAPPADEAGFRANLAAIDAYLTPDARAAARQGRSGRDRVRLPQLPALRPRHQLHLVDQRTLRAVRVVRDDSVR